MMVCLRDFGKIMLLMFFMISSGSIRKRAQFNAICVINVRLICVLTNHSLGIYGIQCMYKLECSSLGQLDEVTILEVTENAVIP